MKISNSQQQSHLWRDWQTIILVPIRVIKYDLMKLSHSQQQRHLWRDWQTIILLPIRVIKYDQMKLSNSQHQSHLWRDWQTIIITLIRGDWRWSYEVIQFTTAEPSVERLTNHYYNSNQGWLEMILWSYPIHNSRAICWEIDKPLFWRQSEETINDLRKLRWSKVFLVLNL